MVADATEGGSLSEVHSDLHWHVPGTFHMPHGGNPTNHALDSRWMDAENSRDPLAGVPFGDEEGNALLHSR